MYQAIYKCRLCGEIFDSGENGRGRLEDFSIPTAFAQTETCAYWKEPPHADLRGYHICQDGSFGFGDFQGLKKLRGDK